MGARNQIKVDWEYRYVWDKTIVSGHFGFEGSIKYEEIIDKYESFHDLGIQIGLFGLF